MNKELERYEKLYKKLTNMSCSQMVNWSKNPCSKVASIGRDAVKRNIKLKCKKLSIKDLPDLKKAVSYLQRTKGIKEGKSRSKDCPRGGNYYANKNWARDFSR